MRSFLRSWLACLVLLTAGSAGRAVAGVPVQEQARSVVHMLDYISVDYPDFVKAGQVLDTAEYAEQREFAMQVAGLLAQLPGGAPLAGDARMLLERIEAKAEGADVARRAKDLRLSVIQQFGLVMTPRRAPDVARGASLFVANCMTCHGPEGRGDGAQAAGLDPAPRNFHDAARMDARSIEGLYNTISLGVSGTSMRAFSELSDDDRWSLAFHVAGLRHTPQQVQRGAQFWKQGVGKDALTGLHAVVGRTEKEVANGDADRTDVFAYLVAHPEAAVEGAPAPIALAKQRLQEALAAYRAGDREAARQHAVSAYLDGFELVEAGLSNVDAPLRQEVERQMMALRGAIAAEAPVADVEADITRIGGLLDRAQARLSDGGLTATAAFFSALFILLREGLEALLVLAAIIALVKKAGRPGAVRYIHTGWIGAFVLGAITWFVARHLLTVSGASRELTEGITALLAAAMLLYVGYWLHNKSNAKAWQAFIRDKVGSALASRTLWALAGISFLAVYRELFEVVLFYESLLAQAGPEGSFAVLWGIAAGALLLAAAGAAILRFSVRLPLGPFFTATAVLLAVMAVVFAGNGVAALQEAGLVSATTVRFISAPLLGIHPTAQTLLMQLFVLVLVVAGMLLGRYRMRAAVR